MRHLSRHARSVATLALLTTSGVVTAQRGPGQPPQGEFVGRPMSSPDGQRVVFSSATSMAQPWQIHSMKPDGTDEKTLTTGRLFADPVAFTPDGKRLIYNLVNRDERG